MKIRPWTVLLAGVGVMATAVLFYLLGSGIQRIQSPPLLQKAKSMVGMSESKVIESLGSPVRVLTRQQILASPKIFPGETYKGDLKVPTEKVLEYHVPIGRVYLYIERGKLVDVGTAWT